MAAPTPVSSLVHSSTLVTAGVYLIYRYTPEYTINLLLSLTGGMTILMARLNALYEIDIKKIIALSTLSQLGLIIFTIGAGITLVRFFHLISHAFFKALLFMTVGAIIHNCSDYQDLRITRVLPTPLPLTLAFSLGANFRLCGLPFLRGFYSKDLAIELSFLGIKTLVFNFVFLVSTALTVAYTTRFILLVLASHEKSPSRN